MALDVENDIEAFIRNQKQKLAQERQDLNQDDTSHHERKTWDRPPAHSKPQVKVDEQVGRTPTPETGLLIGRNSVEGRRKKLQEERQREYNDLINKNPNPQGPRRLPTPKGRSLPVGTGQDQMTERRRGLREERTREYNNMLAKSPKPIRHPPTPDDSGLPLGQDNRQRQQLEEERNKEYRELMEKKGLQGPRKENLPPKPATPETFLNKLGSHESQRKKLEEERKREYNDLLSRKAARGERLPPREGETLAVPGLVDRQKDEQEKIKQRNEEYNEFLRQKERAKGGSNPPSSEKHGNRSADGHGRHQRVADIRQEEDWLKEGPPGAPRRGWTTPTYDEILQKKQQEENRYRRYDDPELPRPGGNPYRPEGFDERRGVLNDDDWLRPQQMKQDLYNAPPHQQNKAQLSPRRLLPEPVGKPRATLLIDPKTVGHEETSSAKRRKKDAYRHELEQQIQEHKDAIKWEKTGDWRVSATGFVDPEKHPDRLRGLPANDSSHHLNSNGRANSEAPPHQPGGRDPRLDYLSPRSKAAYLGNNSINPYLGALDSLSSRTDAMLGRRGDVGLGSTGGGGGILDHGWEGLYDRPRPSVKPIAPSGYENSSYLTDLPSGYNAVNDAYHLYGMRNPLDTYNDQAGPSIPYDSAPAAGKVRFEEPSKSPRKGDQPHHVLPFPVGEDKTGKTRHKQDVQSYQAELQKQIEEQRMKKKREKEEQERLDRKWEEENKNYNPFGRGGGGAPLKDTTGNTLADLRQLRIGPESGGVKQSPRGPPQPASPRMVPNSPPPVSGDGTYARGGHGIFGVPKTYEEKSASDRYKDELRQQIEDKRRREAEEKEKLLAEEEKENRRLQEQQQRIQQEFEAEQRKKIEKEEEARKRNEELQKMTEEKKRAAEHQRKEAEERRLEELRARQEEERRQREQERQQQAQRSTSPPVPALKSKLKTEEEDIPLDTAVRTLLQAEQRGKSPVVPALRTKAAASPTPGRTQPSPAPSQQDHRPTRANSADVLNQLATMRRQLQSERARVENALDRQKNDYEVFDPRLVVQRPPAAPRRDHDVEIFEGARNRAPVSVRRPPPDSANPDIVNEFNYLKHQGSSESRREVRESYPETPHSSNDLEAQQRALIQKQEHNLRRQPLKSVYEQALPNMAPRDLGREESPQVLQSDSAFIDFKQVGTFPEDFDDLPRRNTPARQRRRDNSSSSPRYNPDNYSVRSNPMGSNVSLDVDRISKKNEDRLKRLKDITGDDVSLADPDDVLDRFMSRQKHNRPPSGQTLKDDTWMRPDSRF